VVRIPQTPACDIDWRREFSLPFGVPPGALTPQQRIEYARSLAATGDFALNTYARFTARLPGPGDVRAAPAGNTNRMVLPRFGLPAADDATLPGTASAVVATGAFAVTPPAAGTPEQVEAALAAKLPFDAISRKFAPLPIPRYGADTVVVSFAAAAPALTTSLGLSEPGILGEDGGLLAQLPATLLATGMDGGTLVPGELDRLLLRAPVTGRFRFETYQHYRWNGGAFAPEGPSTTGRLYVQQPHLAMRESAEHTDTMVFRPRLFVFEHVDRAAVARAIEHVLVLHLAFLGGLEAGFRGVAGTEPRLAIRSGSDGVRNWAAETVRSLLRSWTAFLAVLAWRPEDKAVAADLPAGWATGFPASDLKSGGVPTVLAALGQVRDHPAWLASIRFYVTNVHSRLLAGYSWLEVLTANGQHPGRRFPVPSGQPPFTPSDPRLAAQHARLRRAVDPHFRWLACFAGCPIGAASTAYGPGLSTFELEALHAAGTAHLALGLPTAVAGDGPRAGRAMDLAPYAAQAAGHLSAFQAEPYGLDGLHTTADWLVELIRGIHFHQQEPAFVDLAAVMDPDDGSGNPLLGATRFDEHLRAVHLRRQMDAPAAKAVTTASLTWWDGKLGMNKSGTDWQLTPEMGPTETKPPTPAAPFKNPDTTLKQFIGVVPAATLWLSPNPSGYDLFDLESAFLAVGRACEPPDGPDSLPLPVLLALMEREGVKNFAPLNRYVRNTLTESHTLSWEAHNTGPRGEWTTDALLGRMGLLLGPYGFDTFANANPDTTFNALVTSMAAPPPPILVLGDAEDPAKYVNDRVHATWHPFPAAPVGVPAIWKRSRRVHWAVLALMAGFFRQRESFVRNPTTANKLAEVGWAPDPGWLPASSSPPDLTGKTPADPEWKDYLTYYALIYLLYNTSPATWVKYVKGAEAGRIAAGSPLSLRDYLVFEHGRDRVVVGNLVRFAIGLDAYLRLNYLDGLAPKDYAGAAADLTAASVRGWP
jgi:hypothetical protein